MKLDRVDYLQNLITKKFNKIKNTLIANFCLFSFNAKDPRDVIDT